MKMKPSDRKDFWKRTYYDPPIDKASAECFGAEVPMEGEYTVAVTMELDAVSQFDQAGLVVYCDEDHWMKTGIEVVDGRPMLSCVVTNSYSDWSTQPFPVGRGSSVALRLRVHKRGANLVVEWAPVSDDTWSFIRIAHLSYPPNVPPRLGVLACCPTVQHGCEARFREFSITKGSVFGHKA
eukprot:CAMPEP_0119124776 /NCGR_PEP_ID=MMETSP1310-20130426/4293_1 /TAXON_ID=464262 /ORGANISM="Genus nov. species nov., Strain RCC2339" /LENGTH=180 /DNA_ID=CAMNT_0007114779 /DNA_START=242 /DNA_END=784 /DNA_ORIENTATION=-